MELELKTINSQSKKELQATASVEANKLIDGGFVDIPSTLLTAKKLVEYGNALIKGLDSVARIEVARSGTGGLSINGAKLSLSSMGERLDYMQDPIYSDLHRKLKEREAILKLARNTMDAMYDADGVELPKVGAKTPNKEVLKIVF